MNELIYFLWQQTAQSTFIHAIINDWL